MPDYLKTAFDLQSEQLVGLMDELPLWSAPFGLRLLEGIRYRHGIQALDIGCGTGFPLTELAMRLGEGSKVYGLDPWDVAVNRANEKIRAYGIRNAEIISGVAENIPLADNSIDLVVSNNGLNNVNDIARSLSECVRVLKRGGQFIQTMNLETTMSVFYQAMEKVLTSIDLNDSVKKMRRHIHQKRRPLDSYLEQIESHGFSVNSVIHDTFGYCFVDGTTMFNHHFIRVAFLDSWKEIVPADRQHEIFGLIEHEVNARSATEGKLTLNVPFAVIDCEKK